MYHQFNIQQFYVLLIRWNFMCSVDFRTNRDISLYNFNWQIL